MTSGALLIVAAVVFSAACAAHIAIAWMAQRFIEKQIDECRAAFAPEFAALRAEIRAVRSESEP